MHDDTIVKIVAMMAGHISFRTGIAPMTVMGYPTIGWLYNGTPFCWLDWGGPRIQYAYTGTEDEGGPDVGGLVKLGEHLRSEVKRVFGIEVDIDCGMGGEGRFAPQRG